MAACSTGSWIPTLRDKFSGVANNHTTGVTPITSSLDGLGRCVVHGFHISVSASSGGTHKADVRIYSETAATYLLQETSVTLHPNTQSTNFLTNEIPVTSAPYFTITDENGGGGKDYTILFFVKTME